MSGEEVVERACGWCGAPLPDDGTGRRYCSITHRQKARKRRGGKPANISLSRLAELRQDIVRGDYALPGAPCEKDRFPTARVAEKVVRNRGGVGRVYECGDHWHITRRPVAAPKKWRNAFAAPESPHPAVAEEGK